MIPDRKLEQYVPYILRDVEEFRAIMKAGQEAFDGVAKTDPETQAETVGVWRAMERAIKDAFLTKDADGNCETTEYGLSRWETMLGIVPAAQGGRTRVEWMNERQDVILARIRGNAPYTYKALVKSLLSSLFPGDKNAYKTAYKVELGVYGVDGWIPDRYGIKVEVALGNEAVYAAIEAMLRRIIPVNLKFIMSMMYNRHMDYKPFKHGARGDNPYGLAKWTHADLKARKWQDGDLNDEQETNNG